MTYAEFKEKFLPQLNDIRSFAGKKRLADQYLTRIGSGSGRAVYDIDGEKVLKLALNRKGIAQNEVESGMMNDYYIKDLITEVYDAAEDNSWIVAEKAKKVTKKRIEELEDIPDFTRMAEFLIDFEQSNKSRQSYQRNDFTQEEKEFFWDENDFSSSLLDFIGNYGQSAGDMGRPSSYGEVIRDGQPAIVLTDYGLNDEVYDTHYSGKNKQRYQMYELFQFADGNDDILSDIGSAQEIKHGMWAQMPYSVGDGDGVINMEEGQQFVNFVNNRNKYPDKNIDGLPELTDRFHECINNLKTVLETVEDKKKFYGNLLELQGYLIRRGFYNREPLVSEKYMIREDAPKVEQNTLNDRSYADELVRDVADKLNLTTPKYLGSGGFGFAYEIDDNVVLKITSDVSEADAASKLMRANPEHLSEIYNLYKIHDTENDKSFFVILQENIADKPIDRIRELQNIISEINPSDMHYEDILVDIRKPNRFDFDEWQEFAKQILTANPNAGVSDADRQAAYEYLMDILKIRQELIDYNIKSTDYITINNLGYKNGKLKFFDIGGYVSRDEPNIPDTEVIQIPESQQLEEKYNREVADKIASSVGTKLGLSPQFIGAGEFGVAYDIGDDKILKITRDQSEAHDNLRMIGKPLKYIAQPYRVFEIQPNKELQYPTYGIILEKLRTDDEYFNRMYNRLDYVFDKIFGVRFKDAAEAIHDEEELPNNVKREDVENYFKKNPKDGEFFYSLLRIWDEVEKYGSQSLDFFNPDNLGFKPSGLIGYFDVGFGDGFSRPDAEKFDIDINEDGTSIYSTDDEIGADGFPPYNNSNIPPTINNNLDANVSSQMYEDLEYNHVKGDATEDEYEISEDRKKSWVTGSKAVTVKKNCQLGGKADGTSDACNQGDINNLEFTRLDEVGEGNVEPYEVKIIKSTDNNKVYGFKTEDNDRYEIEFNRGSLDDNEWDAIFGVKGEDYTKVTNKGRLYRVMATILKIMNGFFANTKPDMLVIEPIKNMSGDFRRFSLYLSYIGKNLPQGYEMVRNNKEIIIQRSDWDDKYELEEYYSSLVPQVDEGMGVNDLPFKETIEAEGGQIYVVGGTLRDQMLGRPSKDLDIVIRGIPEDQLAHILNKYGTVNAVGKSFAVMKFVPEGSNEEIDVALPRTEISTGEGHKDFEIKADHRLPIEKDLERRDFTVNAIAKDMEGNLIDPFNGQQDLKAGKIKITHPKSFEDDALRMLRAVRFATVLGFEIDPETYGLIRESADKVNSIANDRVQTEFQKIAEQGDASKAAMILKDTGLLKHMGVDAPLLVSPLWNNVNTLAEFVYLLSHNAMSPLKFYMNNMRGDTDIVNELEGLIIGMNAEDSDIPAVNRSVAHNMVTKDKTGKSLQSDILPEKIRIAAQELLQNKYPKTVKELAISGNDIMDAGLKGQEIGKMQRALLINIYADKVRNTREDLLALLGERKDDVKEGYDYYSEPQDTWQVNGTEQDIKYFVKEYDKWNGGYHTDPSRNTVKQFLGAKFEELVNDDKLNKLLYWELIDRELLNEDNVKRVSYSGVVLDDKSRTDLLKVFAPMIPEDWETIAHHMTIKMGGLEDGSEEKQDMEDQKQIVLNVLDYAMDNKVLAVGVEGYNSLNEKPHITVAVNRKDGGKPFMSNNLTNWKPLGFPLKLTGKITEI
jgi:hypothetical protein